MSLDLSQPEALNSGHVLSGFLCGEPLLDEWLKRRALANQASGASRTFVVADHAGRVFGYYSLAAGAVARQAAIGAVRRNMPEPVPVMVLGRLAVDQQARGLQLGSSLLRDAVTRAKVVAQNAGVRALLVHALSGRAREFYVRYGFKPSPVEPTTLMLVLGADT